MTDPLRKQAEPMNDPAIRAQIADILARMNQNLDAEDYEAYISVWTEDAIYDPHLSPATTGVDAIKEFLRRNNEAGFITGKRHSISNLTLDRLGNNVLASFYLSVFERVEAPRLIATAFITDEFALIDGAWKIVRHVTRIDPGMTKAMKPNQ